MKLLLASLVLALGMITTVWALEIKLPENASVNAKLAATFLKDELPPAAKGEIKLINGKNMRLEQWKLTGDGKCVTITAGKHGFSLAAIYYLENICGRYAFSPAEYAIAEDASVKMQFPEVSGEPAFELRDIFFFSRLDRGRTAARRGMNSEGEFAMAPEMDYRNFYGSPKFIHTFHLYFPKQKYFKSHPEWYSEIKGKREPGKGKRKTQLCLSNHELRKAWLEKLRNYISSDRQKAAKRGIPAPVIYDISMNDAYHYCTCAGCNALAAKYNNKQSGVTLDFVNHIAAEIEKEYPDILITTAAYYYNEDAPENIRPRRNVIIVLCDTKTNVTMPLSAPENAHFTKKLADWANISPAVRIWDYNINFRFPAELPYNSEDTYQEDMRLFRAHQVKQLFCELESPALADAREYKMFLKSSMMVNPDADAAALKKRFAQVYYGKAAELFLQYRALLKSSQLRHKTDINMDPTLCQYTHLDLDTVTAAQKIFDDGEKLLAGYPDELRRWRFARMALDRATMLLRLSLKQEYFTKNKTLKGYPFELDTLKKRINAVLAVEVPRRLPVKEQKKFLTEMQEEQNRCTGKITEKALILPEKFANISKEKVFDFPGGMIRIYGAGPRYVDDPESSTGYALKVDVPSAGITFDAHTFPMLAGTYSRDRLTTFTKKLYPKKFFKPGYNWYYMGKSKLDRNCYFFFFRSWQIQQDLFKAYDPANPDAEFDIYLRIKLTGKNFIPGGSGSDAVWFDRLVLVKK